MRPVAHILLALALAVPVTATAQVPTDPTGLLGTATNVAGGTIGRSPSSSRRSSRRATSPLSMASPRNLILAQADAYMNMPLETFHNARRLQPPPFDWTANGCSFGEVSGPFRESFNRACDRHDFGYRNYGAGSLRLDVSEARRTRVDDRLRDDLNALCRRDHAGLTETPCLAAAQAVYTAARSMGSAQFHTGAAPPPAIPTPALPGMGGNQNPNPIPGVPLPGLGASERSRTTTIPLPGAGGSNNNNNSPLPGLPNPMGGGGGGSPIPGLPNPMGGGGSPIPGVPNPLQR